MKPRMLFVFMLTLIFSLSLAYAQSKDDCTAKTASAKSSCCTSGAKMSMTSNTKHGNSALHVVTVGDKTGNECTMKGAKMTEDCTAAEKAHCDMAKSGKMMKTSGKMDCCKGKAKGAEAKNTDTKAKQDKADAKGTN